MVKGATNLTFQDSAATIKLKFGTTNDQTLAGIHVIKVEASLANYPEYDSAMLVFDTFSVEVKACSLNKISVSTLNNFPFYEIKPRQVAVETSFAKFTQSMSICGSIKYAVSTPNAAA